MKLSKRLEELAGQVNDVIKGCPAKSQRLGFALCPKCGAGRQQDCSAQIVVERRFGEVAFNNLPTIIEALKERGL